jgi:hypothetical protein
MVEEYGKKSLGFNIRQATSFPLMGLLFWNEIFYDHYLGTPVSKGRLLLLLLK